MTEPRSEPVTVQILGKEYRVACPEDERNALIASASLLDRRMKEIRDGGKVVGGDRIAVMAALNITHELLALKRQNAGLDQRMRALQDRVDAALQHERQTDS
ncbi:cell division protein ZapA [Ectothiorhodospira lacustris]|uniref:cell division protein ZapA n=1 Tax=Ectothiorhodospira lacustris TaxID=2899127 RepID=UPI001EE8C307|nr:cell division protein ZapA [Ectothiorhodospira lacustris]MCG5501033.1 cell division protein ZapA [Ectothiorhodospira lacustris]MCG5508891.1 cell division protein ZapA [Ectothiorhodospira lacustris]MCG5520682.1 cell division protein ZapA [Ectothiorhodospira lacustris]